MSYPVEILPKENYKIIDSEQLNREVDIYLVRRSLEEEPMNRMRNLNFSALLALGDEGDFYDMSWNLLGIFKSEYVKFIAPCSDWNLGQKPLRVEEVEKLENYRIDDKPPLFFKYRDIYGFPFPYEKNIQNGKKPVTKVLESCVRVDHRPTQANFWHFQFAVYDNKEDGSSSPIKGQNKGWRYTSLLKNTELKVLLITKTQTVEPEKVAYCPERLYKNT